VSPPEYPRRPCNRVELGVRSRLSEAFYIRFPDVKLCALQSKKPCDHAAPPTGLRFPGDTFESNENGYVARTGDDQPIRAGRRMRQRPGQAVATGRPLAIRGKLLFALWYFTVLWFRRRPLSPVSRYNAIVADGVVRATSSVPFASFSASSTTTDTVDRCKSKCYTSFIAQLKSYTPGYVVVALMVFVPRDLEL